MRRVIYPLLLLTMGVSCSKEFADPEIAGPEAERKTELRFYASDVRESGEASAASRTEFGEEYSIRWLDADCVGVYVSGGSTTENAPATVGRDADGKAVFTAQVSPYAAGDLFTAYYPYAEQSSGGVTLQIPARQTQSAAGRFNGSTNPMAAVPFELEDAAGSVTHTVLFRSLGAMVGFDVWSADAAIARERIVSLSFSAREDGVVAGSFRYDLEAVTRNGEMPAIGAVENGSSTVSVSLEELLQVPGTADAGNALYLTMLPGTYTGDLTVTTDRAVYSWTNKTLPLMRSYVRRISLNLKNAVRTERPAVDLSADGTANTYIVSEPATIYRFRADVKGNGVARTFSWTETDGTQITRSYGDGDLKIMPAQMRLLWYNGLDPRAVRSTGEWGHESPVVIGSVDYEDGWCRLMTPAEFVNGNALIAACDADGTVLWSWNIWALEDYDADASARQIGSFVFMDRNLGAMAGADAMNAADKAEAAHAIGNYYQWGRKDPFPAPAEYDDTGYGHTNEMFWGVPTYTPEESLRQDFSSSTWGGSADMMFGSDAAANSWPLSTKIGSGFDTERGVAESVKYPYRWMSWTGSDCRWNYSWMLDYSGLTGEMQNGWRYLWGAPEFQGENALADNLKTIYDPCPVGWKVAPVAAYRKMSDLQKTKWNGYYSALGDLYFPATGQRQAAYGGSQIRALGGSSMVALSSANVAQSTLLRFEGSGVTTYNTYTGAGYNVRCVKETEIEIPAVDLSASGTSNTYIVSQPGTTYKFRADVKGNGVPRTFTWSESDGSSVTRGYAEADLRIAPVQARLVWYNGYDPDAAVSVGGWVHRSPVVIGSVEYADGWCRFTTPAKFVNGNVLIAVYDAGGTILWSWNIWALEDYDADASARQSGDYLFMDRNLGAMAGIEAYDSDEKKAVLGVGNYYQWGRKDPLPAAPSYSDPGMGDGMYGGVPTYTPLADLQQDCSAASWGSSDMMFGKDPAKNSYPLNTHLGGSFDTEQAMAEAVKNPYRWMSWTGSDCAGGYYFWMLDYNGLTGEKKNGWRYLWGAPDYVEGAQPENLKTIYDPCPPTWKLAPPSAYMAFAENSVYYGGRFGRINSGQQLYVPIAGQRRAGFGGSQICDITSSLIMSTPNVGENGIKYYNGVEIRCDPGSRFTGAAYNVRCVKEKE